MTFISLAAVLGKRIRSIKELTSIQIDWRKGWLQLGDDDPWKLFGDYWRNQNVDTTRDGPTIEHGLPLTPEANKIIVRDCYKTFYDLIWEAIVGIKYTGFVLTGQPGTGAPSS
jgi:hypothetical protein